jgi:hypothetical protein
VIAATNHQHDKGVGRVIDGSKREGVPDENLRYATEDGSVVTFDAFRSQIRRWPD